MKCSTLFVVAAAVFATRAGSDHSAAALEEQQVGEKPPIGRYEMYPVGSGVPWEPSGILYSIEPKFEGIAFVEVHPDRAAHIVVEVFGGFSDDGGCAETGVLLASSTANNYTIETGAALYVGYSENLASGSTSWPQTRNGVIVGATFNVSDFLGPTGDGAVFIPQATGPQNIGHAKLCCRTSIMLDINGDGIQNYISLLDTRFSISVTVDLTTVFDDDDGGGGNNGDVGGNVDLGDSYTGISISIDQDSLPGGTSNNNNVETNVQVTVQLETFLCGTPGVNGGKPAVLSDDGYTLGQDFQICVGPAAREASRFELVKFQVVVCENANDRRIVVTEGTGDGLTTVLTTTEVAGSKGLAEGQVAGDNAIAFKTVVTAGFFDGGGDAPPIKCRGEALVRYKDGAASRTRRGRGLTAEFVHDVHGRDSSPSDSSIGAAGESSRPASFPRGLLPRRGLQTTGSARRELKAFAITVGLSIDDGVDVTDDLPIAAATAVLACRRWQSILFVVVAAMVVAS